LLLLLFFLPFTWGRHRRARATTALPRATSLELLILFAITSLLQQTITSRGICQSQTRNVSSFAFVLV
jgi:hypothetical protein